MISAASIQQAVADAHGISVDVLSGKCRLRAHVHPRQEAMFLCRKLIRIRVNVGRQQGRMSLPQIGRRFGNRHHTTVISALKAVEKRRASDPMLRIKMRSMAFQARRTA